MNNDDVKSGLFMMILNTVNAGEEDTIWWTTAAIVGTEKEEESEGQRDWITIRLIAKLCRQIFTVSRGIRNRKHHSSAEGLQLLPEDNNSDLLDSEMILI